MLDCTRHAQRVAQERMAMISWKQTRFQLRVGLLVGACVVTGCAGLKDSPQGKFFLITSFIGSLSSVPYGLTVTMEGFEPYSQSHVMYRGCSQPESVQYLPPNLRPAALLVPLSHRKDEVKFQL